MPVMQADIDAIITAIARGESEVQTASGSRVRYRTVPEMQAALGVLRAELAAQNAATTPGGNTTLAAFSRD